VKGRLEACGLIEDREAMRAGKNMYLKRAIFCKCGGRILIE
jgi:hypothetical protein